MSERGKAYRAAVWAARMGNCETILLDVYLAGKLSPREMEDRIVDAALLLATLERFYPRCLKGGKLSARQALVWVLDGGVEGLPVKLAEREARLNAEAKAEAAKAMEDSNHG